MGDDDMCRSVEVDVTLGWVMASPRSLRRLSR